MYQCNFVRLSIYVPQGMNAVYNLREILFLIEVRQFKYEALVSIKR